ncbi:MAG: sigma-70 family RNA polymerase sigma factor [Acidobacteriota bacterium]
MKPPQNSLSTDEHLILRVSEGDFAAFECLVRRHQLSALRTARRFLGDAHEAEDLAQEAFLQIFRQAHRYNPDTASFKTWFFTILANLCRNALKKRRLVYYDDLPENILDLNDPDANLELSERRRALARAIASLPPNQRLAFILCHYEEFSYAEAARSLDLSVKAVESLLVRAKRNLREQLADLRKKSTT